YLVSPGTTAELAAALATAPVPSLPGCASVSEALTLSGLVDALERLHEYGAGAGEITLPGARPEVAVERDLHAVLARKLDQGEEAADADVRIERERDAGEIDQAASEEALGEGAPLRQLEELACRSMVAPIAEAALALVVGLDQIEARGAI